MIDAENIKHELKIDARALDIPDGAAEEFIRRSLVDAKKKVSDKKIITKMDLERAVSAELKKYNSDLAYIYKNRDGII